MKYKNVNNYIGEELVEGNNGELDVFSPIDGSLTSKVTLSNAEAVDKYVRNSKYWGKVGAFEGAGYSSEGLYRSMLDCIMFTKGKKPFCKVCEQAVYNMIMFYSE